MCVWPNASSARVALWTLNVWTSSSSFRVRKKKIWKNEKKLKRSVSTECERYINVRNEQKRVIATGGGSSSSSITMHRQSQKHMFGHVGDIISFRFVLFSSLQPSLAYVSVSLLWSLCVISAVDLLEYNVAGARCGERALILSFFLLFIIATHSSRHRICVYHLAAAPQLWSALAMLWPDIYVC